ncbi:hypothetical protein BJV78DRAFT_868563 [Lactifluus subvellereus]|nr:hypothetical protein BJV78DRAFT_868563 [Lactifluus subvellereus]
MKPPRLKFSIVQDARIVQAGSLLFFDLLVVVPSAIPTNVIAEFISYSIGALSVLAAFNSLLGPKNFVPTQLDGPILASRGPGRTVVAPERPINQRNLPDRVIRIDNHPFSAASLSNQDVDAFISRSPSPQARQSPLYFPLDRDHEETGPIASPQPVRAPAPAMIARDASPSVVQLESGDHPRRGKILSYSNPVWETLGAPPEIPPVPTHPHISIEITGSPTPSISPSPERDGRVTRVTSHGSTILGSDIIQGTASRHGRDAMRVLQPGHTSMFASTSSIPSFSSRRAAGQSWGSRVSTYPQMGEENAPVSWSLLPEEAVQFLRPKSSNSKSKKSSRSRQSSPSGKSSSSIRSVKSAVPRRLASGFPATTRRRSKVGHVRGPRPPPPSPRIQYEGSWGRD